MRNFLTITAVAAAALALPGAALAQNGNGNGKGNGNGNGRGQAERGDDRDDDQGRGRGQERAERDDDRGRGRGDRDDDRWERAEARVQPVPRGRDRDDDDRPWDEREVRRAVRDGAPVVILRDVPRAVAIQGCPPGLAKKNNGCLPPGLARQVDRRDRDWNDWYWSRNRDDGRWRYDDGYVYRIADDGGVAGWLPVLGGALGLGSVWPQQYQYRPAPDYYTDYWRLNQPYDYRYADGVLYGVDPQTQAINSVVALLTGQQWNVGQRMPAGYDVYNVPYDYRDQYVDTADSWYRYNDGYVYQVDPTTQLVQAVIQLLV
ncbi:hypothetical protein [Brevundimonas sp.]|jgi:hypothetical protein|uniref:hypothetical protein n=1 Tax=Brevundimonas sp. TaxID=1871086 RepID=UPI002E107520|nr:hypothetical protein [Brevundimonas sp.]